MKRSQLATLKPGDNVYVLAPLIDDNDFVKPQDIIKRVNVLAIDGEWIDVTGDVPCTLTDDPFRCGEVYVSFDSAAKAAISDVRDLACRLRAIEDKLARLPDPDEVETDESNNWVYPPASSPHGCSSS